MLSSPSQYPTIYSTIARRLLRNPTLASVLLTDFLLGGQRIEGAHNDLRCHPLSDHTVLHIRLCRDPVEPDEFAQWR